MSGIILCQSKYGATRKYLDWLTELTGFDCVQRKEASIQKVSEYEVIILAGGIYASGIAVFCAGASPYDEEAFKQVCEAATYEPW